VQVRLKSVSNEVHFTLEDETVFPPYLPLYSSGVTEIWHVAHSAHVSRAMHVRLESINNERYFTLETEILFHPYLPSHCSGVNEIFHVALSAHALRAVQVRMKSVSNEGHFTLEAHRLQCELGLKNFFGFKNKAPFLTARFAPNLHLFWIMYMEFVV
jgi:hypothetical protein